MTDQETIARFVAIFNPAPEVKVDKHTEGGECPAFIIGPFTISRTLTVVKGLNGDHEIPSYTLDVDPGDGNPLDLATGSILAVGIALAEQYAGYLARSVEDALVTDALAADYAAEKQALRDAYTEGLEYFRQTQPSKRTLDANPYPYGIAHYDEWRKGFKQGEEETVF